MKDFLTLVRMSGSWSLFDGERMLDFKSYAEPGATAVLIDDFEDAIQGVMTLEGNAAYAQPMIERRLRNEGLVDGESHIIIHRKRAVGGVVQVLYTAVPIELWRRTQAWTGRQRDNCLVVPLLDLVCRQLSGETAVVLRTGRHIVFVALWRDSLFYSSVLAFGDTPDDFMIAVVALAERCAGSLREFSGKPLVRWYVIDGEVSVDDSLLGRRFAEQLSANVQQVDSVVYQDSRGIKRKTAMGALLAGLCARDAINPISEKVSFAAERAMPVFTVVGFVLAIAMIVGGLFFSAQTLAEAEQVDALKKQIREQQAAIKAPSDSQAAAVADEVRALIQRLLDFKRTMSPYDAMQEIRAAAGPDVRITRLRLDGATDRQVLWVEGMIKNNGSDPLARFLAQLRRSGFEASAVDQSVSQQSANAFSYKLERKEQTL